MKTIKVDEFKPKFSQILEWIKKGEDVVISYGKKEDEAAVLVDMNKYQKNKKVKLGLLQGKATAEFADDFKMTEEEFLGL